MLKGPGFLLLVLHLSDPLCNRWSCYTHLEAIAEVVGYNQQKIHPHIYTWVHKMYNMSAQYESITWARVAQDRFITPGCLDTK